MKILSRMIKKSKEQPQEAMGEIDFDALSDMSGKSHEPVADDSGEPNASRATSQSQSDDLAPLAEPEPEVVAQDWEADDWDDDWDDDEDWGDDDLDGDDAARELKASQDKAHLMGEIRDAMVSAGHGAASQDDAGRKAQARSQLTGNDSEDRIMEVTESAMSDSDISRRRSAMAHLKAAAAATKADRVLSNVSSRDPAGDPEEQSPYRDDLAKVVRPHRPNSRPISRQVSQPQTQQAVWDQGEGDEDAALFAASTGEGAADQGIEAELSSAENERLKRAPLDLSEEDFADDSFFGGGSDDEEDDFELDEDKNVFGAADDFEDDDFAPRPSSVVSEAVAFANSTEDEDVMPDEGHVRKKIWEMADDVATEVERMREAEPEPIVNVAPAVAGRAGKSAGRVKTRMLGFQLAEDGPTDVFEEAAAKVAAEPGDAQATHFPAGWIIVVDGAGRGACFTVHNGVSQIGRGEDQAVRLDFGDTSISRNNHAAIAFDDEQGKFFLGHGGKSNLVRLNGNPVLSTEEVSNNDEIRIGETTLKFIALCGEDFTWKTEEGDDNADA